MFGIADVGGVDVAETVDLGGADEAGVDPPLLELPHDLQQPGAPRRAELIVGIAHGVDHAGRGVGADDAALEYAGGVGRVRQLGDAESDDRQPHSDEHHVMIGDLAGRRHDHQLLGREAHAQLA